DARSSPHEIGRHNKVWAVVEGWHADCSACLAFPGAHIKGIHPASNIVKETAMELSSDSVERKASQAHFAVDNAAAKATERAAPAIDRAAQAAHQTVDKVAQAAAPAAD